jgi:hypothetical protein
MNEEQEELLKGLKKYKKKSLYKVARTAGEQRKNLGFDYREVIMKKTTSKHLQRNPTVDTFLSFLTDYFTNLIRGVKWIQIHRVYTVPKDYEYID